MTSRSFRVKLTPILLCHTWSQISDPLLKLRHKLTTPFKKAVILACRKQKQVWLQLTKRLLTFVVECRAVASASVPLVVYA